MPIVSTRASEACRTCRAHQPTVDNTPTVATARCPAQNENIQRYVVRQTGGTAHEREIYCIHEAPRIPPPNDLLLGPSGAGASCPTRARRPPRAHSPRPNSHPLGAPPRISNSLPEPTTSRHTSITICYSQTHQKCTPQSAPVICVSTDRLSPSSAIHAA